jgi:hypothetical protein
MATKWQARVPRGKRQLYRPRCGLQRTVHSASFVASPSQFIPLSLNLPTNGRFLCNQPTEVADTGDRAVFGVCLRPLAGWDYEFARPGHGSLSFVSVVWLWRADHSCRGVLPSVLCLNEIVKPWPARDCSAMEIKITAEFGHTMPETPCTVMELTE